MKRCSVADLFRWFKGRDRKPLVLRGARQGGKSTLVRIFAEEHGLLLHEVNLERHFYLDDVFKTLDIPRILSEIEGLTGEIRDPASSLIFLDEIQATPYALQALRYFYEERGDLAVIAAGSLLEFTLADHSFSMPVGRIAYYHLGPMSFKEYLLARDEELYGHLDNTRLDAPLPQTAHRRLLEKQREFLFVGGMPEAVNLFCETGSFEQVADALRDILGTYLDDFSKYAGKHELLRLQKVFRQIPAQIGKKVKYSNISRENRAAEIKSAIDLVLKAHLCWKVSHSDCSGIPLAAGVQDRVYKLLFIDLGLLNSMLGLQWSHILNMDERKLIHQGSLAEQFIGQELIGLTSGRKTPELYYWLREGKSNNAEVDFVLQSGTNILPIEVKSGKSGGLKSLQQFVLRKGTKLAVRFDLNRPSLQEVSVNVNGTEDLEFSLLSLPLYMVEELPRFVEELLEEGQRR